jgi:hypothetical protein
MSEGQPNPSEEKLRREREKASVKERIIALAKEINAEGRLHFPGIGPEAYAKLKAADEEDPGYMTPVDVTAERMRFWGMKVALGKYPESGNVYIMPHEPYADEKIETDGCIRPKHLDINGVTDEKLIELIRLSRR